MNLKGFTNYQMVKDQAQKILCKSLVSNVFSLQKSYIKVGC